MQLRDDRIEQSDGPATLCRALRKDEYEDRPSHMPHKSKSAGNVSIPRGPVTLPVCPKCGNEQQRTDGGYLRPEDLACDCDCGFVVDEETALFPCDFPPGSDEKMAVVAARYRLGFDPFLAGDRSEQFAVAVAAWA